MEQTVNTFSHGLLMDTHPMMLGTDSLSDALNATLVTMNGNEVILQNDMGNRKVVNAVLPDGYEPVGIKEYGGVIYVASYNPLTNKSQIGSFPSPQRLISKDNKGLTLSDEKNWPDGCTDTVLIPLGDLIIHAGDKFIISFNTDNIDESKISNYNNVSGNKIKSPKNKLYTLAIGVLNSRNEFVDITSDLIRWSGNAKVADNGKSLLDFNRGYFIKESVDSSLNNTIKDQNLKDFRTLFYQIEGANTYSHKLVGPLYLQIKLNHVEEFNYNIYGYKKEEKNGTVVTLIAEGFVTYNCPDSVPDSVSSDSNGDQLYLSYKEGLLKEYFFTFDFVDGVESETKKYGNCTYNPQTNLYSVKLIIEKTSSQVSGNIEYTIKVKSNINETNDDCDYLSGFTSKGTIDVEKLGSGEVELKGFRFVNNFDNEAGTLTVELEAYPKYDDPFDKLILEFWDCSLESKPNPPITITTLVYNGRINIPIDWKTRGLESRTLYNVDLYYTTKNNPNKQSISEKEYYLTTELLNKYYFTSYNLYEKDFKNITSMEIEPVVDLNPIYNNNNPIITSSGSMLTKNTNNNFYLLTTEILLNIDVGLKISYNLNLYPKYLDDYFNKLTVSGFSIDGPTNTDITSNVIITNDNKITGNISLIDKVSGNFENTSTSLTNVFDSVGNYFNDKVINKNGIIRLGMFMASVSHTGDQDQHEIFFSEASGNNDYITLGDDLFCLNRWNYDNTEKGKNYLETIYNGRASRYDIDSYFSLNYDDKVFTVVFKNAHDGLNVVNENYLNLFVPIDDTNDIGSIYLTDSSKLVYSGKMLSCRDSARLLWKTSNGHTAFVDGIIIKKNRSNNYSVNNYSINTSFIDLLNKFYFCRERTKSADGWKLLNITETSEYRDIDVFANIKYNSYNNSDGKSLSTNYLYRLKFTLSKKTQTKELFLCNIKSSEEFYDYVNNFEPKNLIKVGSNIYLFDSEGNEIDPSGIYLKLGNKFKKLSYPPFFTYTTGSNENQVLLSNPKKEALKYFPHDFGYEDDADSETWLSYDSVWKVDVYDIYKLTQLQ